MVQRIEMKNIAIMPTNDVAPHDTNFDFQQSTVPQTFTKISTTTTPWYAGWGSDKNVTLNRTNAPRNKLDVVNRALNERFRDKIDCCW